MATNRLRSALNQLQSALAPPGAEALTDAQLLARFLARQDESAFALLVRRHGPMVLGVCRRVLRHTQDAEDAFQAAFLVLARKANSVLKREALGSWLYMVAYRTAQRARANQARQRTLERQVEDMPHPQVLPEQPQDWRALLDEELGLLPQKYRAAVVLCDLEGQSRREAARQLNLPDGTLSSRLATGRRLLAERLSRRGVALSGGALAAALAEGAASAQVAAPLIVATARAAGWVAAGHLAAVASPVAILTKGVLRAMFLSKLKVVTGVVLVVAALTAGGLAYRSADAQTVPSPRRAEGKPRSELETLRRENELLRLNLEVVLEKVRAQEAELRALRGKPAEAPKVQRLYSNHAPKQPAYPDRGVPLNTKLPPRAEKAKDETRAANVADQVEAGLKRLLDAKDGAARERALDSLDRALRRLREQLRQPETRPPEPLREDDPRAKKR
jgi:RNA polymerase sigma factor (sigma-70 family)